MKVVPFAEMGKSRLFLVEGFLEVEVINQELYFKPVELETFLRALHN